MTTPTAVRQLAADLSAQREKIESAFVSVGGCLTQGAALLNALTNLFDALPDALSGAEVQQATGHLEAVASRATALSDVFGQERADLERLFDVVSAANLPISDLHRTIKMMGIVSINARVTAASIAQDSDDFDVFTTDIATLSESATRTLKEFSHAYRQLVIEVDAAVGQRNRFEAAHAHTLSDLAGRLTATLRALENQRASAVDGSAETSRLSRQIVGQIGSAVMALQVGDAPRQRLEHIETGLEHLAAILSGEPVFDTEASFEDREPALDAIAALEQEQLADTARDFALEVGDAERSLAALAADAETIMARSRGQYGSDVGKTSSIASLSEQLRAAVSMLADFEAERAKLEAVAATVQQTVAVLLGHVEAVQDIEANMRLVSLNAAVRCAQLGPRGASLTVIATQLRELTSETVIAAESAVDWLSQSAALANAFGTSADGAGKGKGLEKDATLALELLSGLDRKLAVALESLDTDGTRVIALLQTAANGLDGLGTLSEAMDDVRMQIAGLAPDAPSAEPTENIALILAGLRRLYTMEAERSVHDALFGSPAPIAAIDQPAEDDFGDFMVL
ncbi:hypothetical protein KKY_3680 [Pelagibacterium halotolerans B2]|uniref:Methyl-accepting chemotaxis protein n=1 Tax=Pelagibacterium halotolerans (strain DSM 22347 / JCM 15775 / CGMCC 1.7692 / B2) TaxID=1082931 RepID=G4RBM1_PELHB|nr:hypothetical protein [Pelagibacterium halotolerans]AEQ53662.1 hypothetical protein KKY_3680 [Pelagibacterium halotolerans B2]